MDTYRAIVSKREVRAFAEREVPGEVVARILQAGRMAGSAKNAQPLRFIVMREREGREALAACGGFAMHVPAAAFAVAIVLVPEPFRDDGGFTIFRGPFDAGRAAQNMMLAAWSEGVASCPASMHDAECARLVLGLPEGHLVANVIAFGYAAEGAERGIGGRPRMPLEEMVHEERW
ncbi:MAG: nitroreductase family protein [Thermoflexaceae bacterium]|nr:nitroreductase family protein [Thermoflexaceae bacterium]